MFFLEFWEDFSFAHLLWGGGELFDLKTYSTELTTLAVRSVIIMFIEAQF